MRLPSCDQWEFVEVHWVDSVGDESGWRKPSRKDLEIHGLITVGQVYEQAPDRICIALSTDRTRKKVDGFITIPAVAITDFWRLRRAPAKAA
jgi:hypothetical protein